MHKNMIQRCLDGTTYHFKWSFSDFEWLYQELINKYGGYIIPVLPEKHLLTKINFESFEVPNITHLILVLRKKEKGIVAISSKATQP